MSAFNTTLAVSKDPLSFLPPHTTTICASKFKSFRINEPQLRSTVSVKKNSVLRSEASRESRSMTQELKADQTNAVGNGSMPNLFDEMKDRFLSFKKLKYMQNLDRFQNLANGQSPKFMVIACADSRVCPSNILGFQPGDAFTMRNIANLIPPFETGPSETNAGLEFAVNSLEVENIFVIGHSCCGGIRALMSNQDEVESSFIGNWVSIGKPARSNVKAAAENLSFDQQCRHCEKESINSSLINLLTYPWIEEKVSKGKLCIHGGYYDFVNCTFEKWTLDYKKKEEGNHAIKDRQFWS